MRIKAKLPSFQEAAYLNDLVLDNHTRLIYHPITGPVYRRRFSMALEMLAHYNPPKPRRLLEIGYGAGLLFPILSSLAREVWGGEPRGGRECRGHGRAAGSSHRPVGPGVGTASMTIRGIVRPKLRHHMVYA